VIALAKPQYDLLRETLEKDSEASNFDPELREQLKRLVWDLECGDLTEDVEALLLAYQRSGHGIGDEILDLTDNLGLYGFSLTGENSKTPESDPAGIGYRRFFEWVAECCKLMGWPIEAGGAMMPEEDPSWYGCYDDGMSAEAAVQKFLAANPDVPHCYKENRDADLLS
jgi:hypothetical protein